MGIGFKIPWIGIRISWVGIINEEGQNTVGINFHTGGLVFNKGAQYAMDEN
jgi:hypothetical protein